MQHFWRVIRIGAIATISGLLLHSQGQDLTPDQVVALNGAITGAVEALYRYFVPHGSTSTLTELEAIINAAVTEAVKEHVPPANNTTIVTPAMPIPPTPGANGQAMNPENAS